MLLTVPKTQVYFFDLDTSPGWSVTGQWEYGPPLGYSDTHGADPSAAATGTNIYGYDLDDYYTNSMPKHYLTAGPFDFSAWEDVELRFQRWLGVQSSRYDHASIEASNNGTNWLPVWNHEGGTLIESAWHEQVCDLSSIADGQPAVYVRWVMGATSAANTYAGWNIDDVAFLANPWSGEGEGEGEGSGCDIDSLDNIFSMLLMIGDANADEMLSQAEAGLYVAEIGDYWPMFDLDSSGQLERLEFTGNMLVQMLSPRRGRERRTTSSPSQSSMGLLTLLHRKCLRWWTRTPAAALTAATSALSSSRPASPVSAATGPPSSWGKTPASGLTTCPSRRPRIAGPRPGSASLPKAASWGCIAPPCLFPFVTLEDAGEYVCNLRPRKVQGSLHRHDLRDRIPSSRMAIGASRCLPRHFLSWPFGCFAKNGIAARGKGGAAAFPAQ